jgi:DNA-binding NarL/FixJ family response regulator
MKDERIMIVDDHAFVRQGLRSMLEGYADLHIVGEASNGVEAIMLVEQLHPSIILMDINMPRMNGIEATAHIKSEYPHTIIIGLSVNANTENQARMTRAGAVRLIPKEQADELLYDVIDEAVKSR